MLTNHKLLIDKNCPMCSIYSSAFTRVGWIDSNCTLPYQSMEASAIKEIDQHKARNEIAMIDLESKKVSYGVESLIAIVMQNYPRLRQFVALPIIYKPLTVLYKSISYNRKVIAPAKLSSNERPCNPDFNLSYRWMYILFVATATAFIVNNFTAQLFPHFGWPHNLTTELAICFGQIMWQAIAAQLIIGQDKTNYLGHMSTVSMMGALLLLPITLLLTLVSFSVYVKLLLFFSVIGFMFFEHIRRCNLLGISSWMTVSWVVYRVCALTTLILLIHFNFI